MSAPSSGIAGLDRKAMEEERLARLGKKRPASPDQSKESPKKLPKVDVRPNPNISIVSQPTPEASQDAGENQGIIEARSGFVLEYPHGVLRRTWAFGHERQNDIKIEEVLQKQHLRTAVISSFNWDFDWLATKFDAQTKLIFVMQARNDSEKKIIQDDFEGMSKKIRLCFPPMSGYAYACMHSKLMLLFYPKYLRIVVPSANFVPHDWGETGIMENSVFLVDLPRLPEAKQGIENDTMTPFSRDLLRLLDAMQIHEDVSLGVFNFDFSNTEDIQFVHTIGGSHFGTASKYTGFPGLSRAVRGLKLQTSSDVDLQVDMVASSVGAIDQETMETLYRALRGFEPIQPTASKSKIAVINASGGFVVKPDNFRIIFPSRETVQQSTGGPENGGTIFLKPEYYKRPKFPSSLIRDYKSRRTGLLSHNKLIFARSPTTAFLYHGSANLSQAAWGKLSFDKDSKGPKLTATNWECGVLLPVRRVQILSEESQEIGDAKKGKQMSLGRDSKMEQALPIEVFETIFGVPFEYPAKEYEKHQVPWSAGT